MNIQLINRSFLIFCFTSLVAFSTVADSFDFHAFSIQRFEVTRLDERTLQLRGNIVNGDYQKFKAMFDSKVKVVRVSGGGGSAAEAVKMGLDLINSDVDVIIDGPCFSSCANYHFLAGKNKTIVGDGFVGFHGSPWHGKVAILGRNAVDAFIDQGKISASMQKQIDEERARHPEYTNEFVTRQLVEVVRPMLRDEREFFQKTGVSPELINNSSYGRFAETVPECRSLYPLSTNEKSREPFFHVTQNKMREYGVTHLSGEQNWGLAIRFAQLSPRQRRDDGSPLFCVGATDAQDLSQTFSVIMEPAAASGEPSEE